MGSSRHEILGGLGDVFIPPRHQGYLPRLLVLCAVGLQGGFFVGLCVELAFISCGQLAVSLVRVPPGIFLVSCQRMIGEHETQPGRALAAR